MSAFVVQQHRASTLHYDFQLKIDRSFISHITQGYPLQPPAPGRRVHLVRRG